MPSFREVAGRPECLSSAMYSWSCLKRWYHFHTFDIDIFYHCRPSSAFLKSLSVFYANPYLMLVVLENPCFYTVERSWLTSEQNYCTLSSIKWHERKYPRDGGGGIMKCIFKLCSFNWMHRWMHSWIFGFYSMYSFASMFSIVIKFI